MAQGTPDQWAALRDLIGILTALRHKDADGAVTAIVQPMGRARLEVVLAIACGMVLAAAEDHAATVGMTIDDWLRLMGTSAATETM